MKKIAYIALFAFAAFGCTAIVDTYSELPGDGPVTMPTEGVDGQPDAGAAVERGTETE